MDSEAIDQLTGVELRKAVAEAVGWPYDGADQTNFHVTPELSWNDALAACEAAGMLDFDWDAPNEIKHGINIVKSRQDGSYHAEIDDGCSTLGAADADDGPTVVCRALLKALAAKEAGDD